jgi:raffinose/stachyose/melibiose transport system permease protein
VPGSTARRLGNGLSNAALVAVAAAYLLPLYLLVSLSLKTPQEIAANPFSLGALTIWSNYSDAWERSGSTGAASMGQALGNSVTITVTTVLVVLALSTLAGYVLGRRRSRLSTVLYLGFLVGITLPVQLTILPLYQAFDQLGLAGSRLGAVLLYVGILTPFATFLVTGFVRALPRDYEDAALIDGCGWWRCFLHVVLPLLRPIVGTVAILVTVAVWNDFFGQLVILNGSGKETLPVTVFSFAGQYSSQYQLLSAGLVIALLPVLVAFLVLQRHVLAGFSGGLKG